MVVLETVFHIAQAEKDLAFCASDTPLSFAHWDAAMHLCANRLWPVSFFTESNIEYLRVELAECVGAASSDS